MKKIPLLLFLFVCITGFHGRAQNEYFLHNPIWTVYQSCAPVNQCAQNTTFNYYVNGDTIINSLVYKKVFKKGVTRDHWLPGPPIPPTCSDTVEFINTQPSVLLRSAGQLVYCRIPPLPSEQLLFDFSLQVGDTVPLSYANPLTDMVVIAIDSVWTAYGYLKRMQLWSNQYPPPALAPQYLLEGYGFGRGLTESILGMGNCVYMTNCYSLGDTAYYPLNYQSNCDLMISTGPELEKAVSLRLYPNPAGNLLQADLHGLQISAAFFYDIAGKRVAGFGDSGQYDIAALAPGCYMIELQLRDGKTVRRKFIKQ